MARDWDSNQEDDFAPSGEPKNTGNGFSGTDNYSQEIGYGKGGDFSNGGNRSWDPKRDIPEV